MNFDTWWNQNRAVYLSLNISRDVACTIWNAAIDNGINHIRNHFNK